MIPQRNISLISNTLMSAGGRRIPEAVIERDYVLAWFLTGLAGIHCAKFWHSKVARLCEVAHLRTIGFRKTWISH